MHRNQLLITAITTQGLSCREAARRYGVSKSLVYRLHQRWLTEGDSAFEPRSRAPHTHPTRTPDHIRARILTLRHELLRTGSDAGADTICEYLTREHLHVSRSTIWRVLTHASAITPHPQKRPRSSWTRFQAAQPNEMWQSDFTHHRLTTGQDIEIIGWLDDHSRYLLHLTAHPRITGATVVETFQQAATRHGYPASTLTDNGMVYTTRLARGGLQAGHNSFETLLKLEGITQKNGRPYEPTTQGKIERFCQTLKRFLAQHPARTLTALQTTLDAFIVFCNEVRPTARSHEKRQHSRTLSSRKPHPPGLTPLTCGRSDTTSSALPARSPSATAAHSNTLAWAAVTLVPRSSASSTDTTQPSSHTPVKSSANT